MHFSLEVVHQQIELERDAEIQVRSSFWGFKYFPMKTISTSSMIVLKLDVYSSSYILKCFGTAAQSLTRVKATLPNKLRNLEPRKELSQSHNRLVTLYEKH